MGSTGQDCERCGGDPSHRYTYGVMGQYVGFRCHDNPSTPENPAHYSSLTPEPLSVIESWGLPFHEAQVLKYISRAGKKVGPGETADQKRLEDLKKARVYLERRIQQLEKK